MKIIIPVSEKTENSNINDSLGEPYYMLYDTDTKVSEMLPNSAMDSPSGAGIKAAQTIIDTGANVLLTIRCGDRAYEVLKTADIKVMAASPGTAKSNIEAYLEGKLSELNDIHSGHFHGKN